MVRSDEPHRETVLVVDPDPWVRGALSEILVAAGYVVIQATNGFSGIRLALVTPPSVILLGLALPELDGAAVLSELRRHITTVAIPVLLLLDACDVPRSAAYPDTQGVVCRRVSAAEVLAQVSRAIQPHRVVPRPET